VTVRKKSECEQWATAVGIETGEMSQLGVVVDRRHEPQLSVALLLSQPCPQSQNEALRIQESLAAKNRLTQKWVPVTLLVELNLSAHL
jgi:hypothetical protein